MSSAFLISILLGAERSLCAEELPSTLTPGISGRPLFALRWMPLFGAAGAMK